jgi:L-lactate dehydrogenase complex protein LldE
VRVGLFVPCYVDQLAPSVGLAAAAVLERVGCEVVVAPSGSCVATVRRYYGELGVGLDAEGRRTRERTFELGEFLVGELGRVDVGARFAHRVALLQSCHGLRELRIGTPSEQPGAAGAGAIERLLRAARDLELVLPERPDECCGFGGAFSVEFPEVSGRMGRDRLHALAATGAEFVTATDATSTPEERPVMDDGTAMRSHARR